METLTKENFWNEMEQKYPKAMAHFQNWIDGYKETVKWNYFFGAGHNDAHNYHGAPKYHELPIAMQFGIFVEYLYYWANGLDYTGMQIMLGQYLSSPVFITGVKDCITGLLAMMEDCPI